MKKRVFCIIILFVISAIMIYRMTMPSVQKWTYSLLPNSYVIQKKSDINLILGKQESGKINIYHDDKQIGLEGYIAEFCYGKRYIALKYLHSTTDTVSVQFYIIDTENDNLYGPYQDEETYETVKETIVDEDFGDWIKTISIPEGAME